MLTPAVKCWAQMMQVVFLLGRSYVCEGTYNLSPETNNAPRHKHTHTLCCCLPTGLDVFSILYYDHTPKYIFLTLEARITDLSRHWVHIFTVGPPWNTLSISCERQPHLIETSSCRFLTLEIAPGVRLDPDIFREQYHCVPVGCLVRLHMVLSTPEMTCSVPI